MTQINDEVLRVTGGPTVQDGQAIHFSKTATESIQDAELRWLNEQIISAVEVFTIADAWFTFAEEQLIGGRSVNDIQLGYWESK